MKQKYCEKSEIKSTEYAHFILTYFVHTCLGMCACMCVSVTLFLIPLGLHTHAHCTLSVSAR